MRTIWKFDLNEALESAVVVEGTPVIALTLPLGSVTLDVQIQGGRPVFWVDLQDGNTPNVNRFAVIGTGRRMPLFVGEWEGTWQDGPFVWHLYSVNEALYQIALEQEAT